MPSLDEHPTLPALQLPVQQLPVQHLPAKLTVRRWPDPVLDVEGFDARSEYVERFWLPILGPTSTWLLRRLFRGLDGRPEGFRLDCEQTSRAIGLGGGLGRSAPLARSIDRLVQFNAVRWLSVDELSVRTRLPWLSPRQLARVSPVVRQAHQNWAAERAAPGRAERAFALAGALLSLGDAPGDVDRQLNSWGFDPALAQSAADAALAVT